MPKAHLSHVGVETATALAYGGAGRWISEGLASHTPRNVAEWPRSVQILISDHQKQPISSPSSLVGTFSELVCSPIGTFLSPEASKDYLLSFSLVAVGELSRHSKCLTLLVSGD